MEVSGSLVAPLVFKTSVGLNKVPGGFDSHSPPLNPPISAGSFQQQRYDFETRGLGWGPKASS